MARKIDGKKFLDKLNLTETATDYDVYNALVVYCENDKKKLEELLNSCTVQKSYLDNLKDRESQLRKLLKYNTHYMERKNISRELTEIHKKIRHFK